MLPRLRATRLAVRPVETNWCPPSSNGRSVGRGPTRTLFVFSDAKRSLVLIISIVASLWEQPARISTFIESICALADCGKNLKRVWSSRGRWVSFVVDNVVDNSVARADPTGEVATHRQRRRLWTIFGELVVNKID